MNPIFNYIITIHNKENLIGKVLESVIKCSHQNSYIYPVLDGCTDKSEEIVDKIIIENQNISIIKIKLDDVHEILSINEGLKISNQFVEGYNIILQDDVILLDYTLEDKINQLYKKVGKELAYLSFRLGANLKKDILDNEDSLLFDDYVESAYGHGIDRTKMLLPGQFAFRSIAIKSPICIPTRIIREFGLLDEQLAPCFHDDTEYCIRLLENGYKNGVFSIKYESDLDWGGTRKNPNPNYAKYISDNLIYLKKKYSEVIPQIISVEQDQDIYSFNEFIDEIESKSAVKQYKESQRKLKINDKEGLTAFEKVKYDLSRGMFQQPLKAIYKLLRSK